MSAVPLVLSGVLAEKHLRIWPHELKKVGYIVKFMLNKIIHKAQQLVGLKSIIFFLETATLIWEAEKVLLSEKIFFFQNMLKMTHIRGSATHKCDICTPTLNTGK